MTMYMTNILQNQCVGNNKMKHKKFLGQIMRYLVTGVSGVALDAMLYCLLLKCGVSISPAKGISVTSSVIYGYFMNASWTFRAGITLSNLAAYCVVYSFSIVQNVITNSYLAHNLPQWCFPLIIAFVVATAFSMCINFCGLKFWVFKE